MNAEKPPVYYEPVSIAMKKLRDKGFTADFKVEENCLVDGPRKYSSNEFDVVEIYRYEGDSDPGDEATVYGIVSNSGSKGVLVTGFGASMDRMSQRIVEKLRM